MSITLVVLMVSQVFADVQTHQSVHTQYVQSFVYQLHLNKPVLKTSEKEPRNSEINNIPLIHLLAMISKFVLGSLTKGFHILFPTPTHFT